MNSENRDKYTYTDVPLCASFLYGSGRVVYTSFHNEAQISEDVQKLLEYIALITSIPPETPEELEEELEKHGYEVEEEVLGGVSQGQTTQTYSFWNDSLDMIAFGLNWMTGTFSFAFMEYPSFNNSLMQLFTSLSFFPFLG
jgi:hypothetical protein